MSHENIYQFINEYNINNEVRASYNSIINIIDNSAYNLINEIDYRNDIINPIYYDTYIINNILSLLYLFSCDTRELIVFNISFLDSL